MRNAWMAALTLGMCLATSEAQANGRYPQSNQVYFSETDPNLVVLRVTFGLLISTDRGRTFDWICEGAIGFYSNEDPMYALTPTSRIVASTYEGIKVSPDRGCSFGPAAGVPDGHLFVDLAARPGKTSEIVILESAVSQLDDAGLPVYQTQLWETSDEGRTVTKLGPALDPKLFASTVEIPRGDKNRIYLAGKTSTRDGLFLVSRDRGATWESTPIPLGERDVGVFIAGVDPTDDGRVYLRTSGNANNVPAQLIVARVGASAAATTVTTVFTGAGVLPGFALSPDGKKIFVGGPLDGVQAASTTDFAFEKRSSLETYCLAFADDGLWGCSTGLSKIVLGVSTDEGRTFEKRVDFCGVRGPLSCNGGSTFETCSTLWPLQSSLLGCFGSEPGRVDGGGASDSGFATSSSGTGTSASPSGSGSSSGSASGGGSGCDCRMEPRSNVFGAVGAGLAALLAIVRRRRQRKSASE